MATITKLEPTSFSDKELLTSLLMIDEKVVENILKTFKSSLRLLRSATMEDLLEIEGVNEEIAIKLLTAVELSTRFMSRDMRKREFIRKPLDAAKYVFANKIGEGFSILFMNSKNQILKESLHNKMTITTGEIFSLAVKCAAKSILCINHYSTEITKPTEDDLNMLNRIEDSADLLGIRFVDYLIIGGDEWLSMREEGYLL